jgi:hypothetical protein
MTGHLRNIAILWFVPGFIFAGALRTGPALGAAAEDRPRDCGAAVESFEEAFDTRFAGKLFLLDVNADYILELYFDEQCRIERIIVAPKYWREEINPAWTEPDRPVDLTSEQYQLILEKINEVQKIGAPVDLATGGIVTNTMGGYTDEYEHGFIERRGGPCDTADSPCVHYFEVLFFREIRGVVEDSAFAKNRFGTDRERITARVAVQGRWYYVAPGDIKNIQVGEVNTLLLAGPDESFLKLDDDQLKEWEELFSSSEAQ